MGTQMQVNCDSDTSKGQVLNEDLIDLKHLIIQNVFLNDILLGSILKLFQLFGVPISADYGRR